MTEKKQSGKVYLVGAGPGDPGLLTLNAYKVLKACDVVIYDALMNPDILDWVSPQAEKIFIGPSRHTSRLDQREVEQLMVSKARQGNSVVRLKGGDPFIFGRGGEEAEVLTAAGIKWAVIPGISSGQAAPAYAGIPLTHRDCASSVTFITGHESKENSKIEWDKLRYTFNTLVIFMGATRIKNIVDDLQKSDYKPNTPVAVIESGTYPDQRVRTGTLRNIVNKIADDPIKTPALIVVGEVVKYRKKLTKYLALSKMNGDYPGKEILDKIT
jgi:uroporphyrin-III C-methyltransferase